MNTKKIAEFLDGQLVGDGEIEILRVASFESAGKSEIAFVEKAENVSQTNASVLLVPENFEAEIPCPFIKVKNPKLAFAQIAEKLHPPKQREIITHETAVISENAKLGKDLFIGAFVSIGDNSEIGDGTNLLAGAKVGDNVKVGKNCVLHPNIFIADNCRIGNNVILHAGVVIGADGFGYVRDGERGYVKFPQIGTVIIEDDVEIGANTCIDRGALGETRIGEGTKIDNLVQIAHNVQIGKRVVIASQTGISGSTDYRRRLRDRRTGRNGRSRDGQNRARSSVRKPEFCPERSSAPGVWWGTPVQPLDEYKRQNAMVKGLGRLREEVKELKKQLAEKTKTE